ncbi:MAG: PQQ-dependent sugar dehydrogenase [Planctomycetaceae bacterium]
MTCLRRVIHIGIAVGLTAWHGMFAFSQQALPAAESSRAAWTTSRVAGSPEPPLPLSIEPVFPSLTFADPMQVRWQADVERYFVCELAGKVWSFPDSDSVSSPDLAVDLKASLRSYDPARSGGCDSLYSMVFDPQFARNRYVYLCMIFSSKTGQPLPDGSRVSRFRVTEENPPRIDVESELPIITWVGGGHNGCDLAFDDSGCLLISTGDATEPSPPDRLKTGQDISDLLASVLRIDVSQATAEQPYKIPPDNPFVDQPEARGEVWAFGFRNPWRISIDPPSGQLWLGDVGWEKWELVHRVVRGGNYGWSAREGNELIQSDAVLGPGAILPTRVALPHTEAASITGGFVYRGNRLDAIRDQYLFGDWITGRIWAVPLDDTSPHREVASGQLRIVAFAPDREGEPLIVNHFNPTTLFKLTPNLGYANELAMTEAFPRRLSETGIFRDVITQEPSPGVREFTINQPQWQDGAVGRHFIALPGREKVVVFNQPRPVGTIAMFNSRLHYPAGTVLAKTLSLPARHVTDASGTGHKIETQLLHFDGRLWRGYSYVWNEQQTDADLAPAAGLELTLPGTQRQRWRVHSRTDCMQCHNPWPETTLAFTPEQLHQPHRGDHSQWLALVHAGFVDTLNAQRSPIEPEKCVRRALSSSPGDSLELRARSYLHANCAHCHQNGAGAGVSLSLKIADDEKSLNAIDVAPTKGTFGLNAARLIAPGDSLRSVLLFRMASSSTGRMPHIGSQEVDFGAVEMIDRWINGLSAPAVSVQTAGEPEDLAADLLASSAVAQATGGDSAATEERMRKALKLAVELARARSVGANAADGDDAQSMPLPASQLSRLARAPDPLVSALFEAFVPPGERQRRLGTNATYADVAEIVGDPVAGEAWFFDPLRSQCSKCHRVGERGSQVGPDLMQIGTKRSAAQLFEALVDPNRTIEPAYQSHTVLLSDGQTVTGLLANETETQLTLITAQGERMVVDIADIESRRLDSTSLMPSGLASELTAQQAADLLAYLASLQ